jgi:phosphoribosylaminoimidazole carboxylase
MDEAEEAMQPLIRAVDAARAGGATTAVPASTAGTAAKSMEISSDPKSKTDGRASLPLVAVTMGSDSDLHVLKPGLALLAELEIPYEVTITSAHRTPGRMFDFAHEASGRGIRVIIAAAGGAAHLPGMIASSTPLPVIGVPVRGSTLDGMDSLLSIVQMPVRPFPPSQFLAR